MVYLFILSLIIIIIFLIRHIYTLLNKQAVTIELNNKTREENEKISALNQKLNIQLEQAKQQLDETIFSIKRQNEVLNSLKDTTASLKENAKNEADEVYRIRLQENEIKLEERYNAISADKEKDILALDKQLEVYRQSLKDLEDKQLAYIKAQQRQQEIEQKQDYFRLVISEDDKSDIKLLRDLQKHLIKKESIDKVIYETYYKPAYDILMSHLFKDNKEKVCGIYKITDLVTGLAYIGQSVDCKERAKQHIKASLAFGKSTNKLYQQMQKSGQDNFIFEILEEVPRDKLNEREIYWINFYKTKDQLNSTRGGS